jgi:hypothetical protein
VNRRNFLALFSAGIAGIALEQAIPLGRAWSFPSKIVIPSSGDMLKPGDQFSIGSVNFVEPPRRYRVMTVHLTQVAGIDVKWMPTAACPPDSSHTPS